VDQQLLENQVAIDSNAELLLREMSEDHRRKRIVVIITASQKLQKDQLLLGGSNVRWTVGHILGLGLRVGTRAGLSTGELSKGGYSKVVKSRTDKLKEAFTTNLFSRPPAACQHSATINPSGTEATEVKPRSRTWNIYNSCSRSDCF
jgi:hypothetical protein